LGKNGGRDRYGDQEREKETMKIIQGSIIRETRGSGDFLDITGELAGLLRKSGFSSGTMTVFVGGSTAGITTFEYEPGLLRDAAEFFEKVAPKGVHYHHDDTWGDANGYGHIRAMFTGPSLVIPFHEGKLKLGTWQQVVLAEFDNRPRRREVSVTLMGE
jgi:secondary thiamine-phosphate synthase enzyme